MRIYMGMSTALGEVRRDLAEMGVRCHPSSMQDKKVGELEEYETLELIGYSYMIDHPTIESVMDCVRMEGNGISMYVIQEFADRISGEGLNPGTAWKHRKEVWEEFLECLSNKGPRFSYTYSERMHKGLGKVIKLLDETKDSRQGVMTIYLRAVDDYRRGGGRRVPCSMHYQFIPRDGELHMVYVMRSCDAMTHLPVDMALGIMLQDYVADELKLEMGNFYHQIGSLHMYRKDASGIF